MREAPQRAKFSTRPTFPLRLGEGTHTADVAGIPTADLNRSALPHVFVYPCYRSQRHVDVSMRVYPAPMGR